MNIDVIRTGLIRENCYIVSDENNVAAVVDPGDNAGKILAFIEEKGYKPEVILITHGHFDHIGAAAEVKRKTGAKVAIHSADKDALRFEPDIIVEDGDVVKCGDLEFAVIETPGHTPGCVCYVCDNAMFSGDTLFYESIGRTDMEGGDFSEMRKSLAKLAALPHKDMDVFPGHMQATTLEHERMHNPFFGM
jgi:Zn-dependent hydrolases, including glyoxylases